MRALKMIGWLAAWPMALGLLLSSYVVPTSLLAGIRPTLVLGLGAIEVALVLAGLLLWRRMRAMPVVCVGAAVALTLLSVRQGRSLYWRSLVLDTPPAQLEPLGAHFIVGFRDPAQLRELVAKAGSPV
jgi:hypothetical protein